jgi:uncharacterized protein with HEPN domain
MLRDFRLYLDDILESINRIIAYSAGISCEELLNDTMRMDAIVRNLEIIGEAASKLPVELKNKYPEVEWRKISNFRNILAHEYFGIDYEILWDIIINKITPLQKAVRAIMEKDY